ncbi:MAG TPA: hypothetical protein VK463_15645 [Desulfomonilaceae bacterium]|nr:hypothetical protein [Desulfomonilaceae bacterium]
MQKIVEMLPYVQNFFQLNFLFSGLEVSSTSILIARVLTFIVFGMGAAWALFRIVMKLLDCVQTFLQALGPLPRSFFLLLLLVIPLSTDSLGAKWIGYILLVACLLGLASTAALILVLWKYGVDQALRLIDTFRSRGEKSEARSEKGSSLLPDRIITGSPDAQTSS